MALVLYRELGVVFLDLLQSYIHIGYIWFSNLLCNRLRADGFVEHFCFSPVTLRLWHREQAMSGSNRS